jgi:hypothetical protein
LNAESVNLIDWLDPKGQNTLLYNSVKFVKPASLLNILFIYILFATASISITLLPLQYYIIKSSDCKYIILLPGAVPIILISSNVNFVYPDVVVNVPNRLLVVLLIW